MSHELEAMSMSIEVPDDSSPANNSYVSNLSVDDRNDELNEIFKEHYRINYASPTRLEGTDSSCNGTGRRNAIDICDRLYREGQKKEKQRAMDIRARAKLGQENYNETSKLRLATQRSYTPMRSRPGLENVHDHLYNLSRQKQIKQEKKKEEEVEAIEHQMRGQLISPQQKEEVVGRLYQRSKLKQQEGKKLRKEIERKLAPKTQTPSKKIPLSKASEMYERGLLHKAQKEKKIEDIMNAPRESTFPKMRSHSRSSRSSRSSSRARSQTPSRRDSARAITPSRRKSNDNFNKSEHYFRKGKNKLPPGRIKTREKSQSPSLRS